jgi:hypothetical protein
MKAGKNETIRSQFWHPLQSICKNSSLRNNFMISGKVFSLVAFCRLVPNMFPKARALQGPLNFLKKIAAAVLKIETFYSPT